MTTKNEELAKRLQDEVKKVTGEHILFNSAIWLIENGYTRPAGEATGKDLDGNLIKHEIHGGTAKEPKEFSGYLTEKKELSFEEEKTLWFYHKVGCDGNSIRTAHSIYCPKCNNVMPFENYLLTEKKELNLETPDGKDKYTLRPKESPKITGIPGKNCPICGKPMNGRCIPCEIDYETMGK